MQIYYEHFHQRSLHFVYPFGLRHTLTTYRGLPQNSSLSSILFNVYMSIVIKRFNVPNVNILLYANDIIVYISHKILNDGVARLNAALTIVSRVPNDIFLSLGPSKSKCMIFSKRKIFDLHIFAL